MACMFRPDQLKEPNDGLLTIRPKANALMLRLTSGTYCDDHAREYAVNGLARRIQTISRCIMQVYKILPPDQSEIPEIDTVYDAMIYIQAAIFNTYGALDNLAFIWVLERKVLGKNGRPLPNMQIGLAKGKGDVRGSFPEGLQNYLHSMDDWLDNLESFRHSLGHRIPLYIPPRASNSG